VLTGAPDNKEITEWVAALAIGNAELVSCVRMTDEDRPRLPEKPAADGWSSPDQGDGTHPA